MTIFRGQVPNPAGVYPLNGEDASGTKEPVFPDFRIWKHSPKDDIIMKNHLQKGYYEAAAVPSESHSGRQIFTQLLNRTTPDVSEPGSRWKMGLLSDVMVRALARRREINKIRSKSTYRPPPRVTLTDHKRDLWMRNLADASIPLRQLARAIPHGLRNRFLLEQCLAHRVPVLRALWLVRCVSANEQRQLKRKLPNPAALGKWMVEWTEQVVQFLEQVVAASFAPASRDAWRFRLSYILDLSSNLYLEDLLSRETFLAWIVNYLDRLLRSDQHKLVAVHFQFVRLFWSKLIAVDYISKELGEKLLRAVSTVQQPRLLAEFRLLVQYLFYYNSDAFIIPNSWNALKSTLRAVIDLSYPPVCEQYRLIAYRNESMMIDESAADAYTNFGSKKAVAVMQRLEAVRTLSLKMLCRDTFEDSSDDDAGAADDWKTTLSLLLRWSITTLREQDSGARICAVCSLLRLQVQQLGQVKSKKNRHLKLELEMAIIDFAYQMAETLRLKEPEHGVYSLSRFLLLVTELHALGLFVLSSYLRRLIASGVIYLQDADSSCYVHLLILDALPVEDSNARNILRRLADSTGVALRTAEAPSLQERLATALDSLPATFDLDALWPCDETDPEAEPLDIGSRARLYPWFSARLRQDAVWLQTPDALLFVYRLCDERFRQTAPFLALAVEHADTQPTVPRATLSLLLRLVALHTELLAYCHDGESSLLQRVHGFLAAWAQKDKHGVCTLLLDVRFDTQLMPPLAPQHTEFLLDQLDTSLLGLLGLSSPERLLNAAEFSHSLNQAITQYWNVASNVAYAPTNNTPVARLLKQLQLWRRADFGAVLLSHLRKFVLPTLALDYDASLRLVLRLIIDGFVDIHAVLQLFAGAAGDDFHNNGGERLAWDLLFCDEFELTPHDALLLACERKTYRVGHTAAFARHLVRVLCKAAIAAPRPASALTDVNLVAAGVGVGVDDLNPLSELSVVPVEQTPSARLLRASTKIRRPNALLSNGLWFVLAADRHLLLDSLRDAEQAKTQTHNLLALVGVAGEESAQAPLDSLVRKLNYFSLPLAQLLFARLLPETVRDEGPADLLLGLLAQLDGGSAVLAGDLFELLDDPLKLRVLHCCEELYLGSEQFPRLLVNGRNCTRMLMDIASACSRLREPKTIALSDSLVFSLNLSLEKLMYYCSNMDATRSLDDLEQAVMFVSRIVLIHRGFLVDLILKRSVNLQRDVFLVNLTKLFSHAVMERNFRLKNLLYDTLISLKVQLAEALNTPSQPATQTPQPPFITSLSLSKGTPTSSSFLSPTNSPLPTAGAQERTVHTMNITPPSYNNKLKFLLADPRFARLRDDALPENEHMYYLVDTAGETMVRFHVRGAELIEDATPNTGVNDACVSLQFFNASIEKKNPA
ncbi:hypothetical protein KL918_004678 [Ogataea parapolymorpha]|uniref:Mediator of RNA polymerase II transcription subunit 12 n=1 Tax=Ogataea parapolymorpha (strain ATCC 26012 / BCRC 20466 / JCM 22074 / NRRL Y-7560 / DL-1) TaxID=871575 RepID=W1QKK2_OGAPD|nr:Mediator of RNA polymerase II transcription subunit 12 [Ogataea parapolymorpha DL-1]ESX03632.1 Mediator of RNA polymerase II transcription subunit 12 [Ogataea parapolymorpha DL-1]KAG7865436.1 hypothetical protein KL918_004678 [Ogataea parapolymorpha]KAG7873881.1 hypothetical protein KL916_002041 [Ogataea parapolymorpha]